MEGLPTPLSRVELYLAKAAGMDVTPPEPKSRLELFLAKIAGMDVEMPAPLSLKEMWLAHVAGSAPIEPLAIEGAFYIDNQKVDVRYLAVAAGVIGATLPEKPQNRKEQYWAVIASGGPIVGVLKYVTGTNITLTDVVSGIEELQFVYGDTYQQTYSGANLFSTGFASSTVVLYGDNGFTLTKPTYRVVNFDYSTDLPAGTYTISGTVVNKTTANPVGLTVRSSSANLVGLSIGETGSFSSTFTTTEPIHRFYFYILATEEDGATITFDKLQVEAGSTASPFEPYTGGTASPNPDYPQDVQVVTGEQTVMVRGKNLFDLNETGGRGSNATKTVEGDTVKVEATSSANAYATILIPNSDVLLGKTCTISFGNISTNYSSSYSPRMAIHETKTTAGYYANTTVLGFHNVSTGYSASFTFPDSYTSDNNGFVVVLYVSNAGSSTQSGWYAEFSDIQLEVGGEPTVYGPYVAPQSYTVDLGSIELCKIGNYRDKIFNNDPNEDWYDPDLEDNAWYVHKEIAKYTFMGTETWVTSPYGTNTWRLNNVIYFPFDTNELQIISNIFTGIKNIDRNTAGSNVIYSASGTELNIRNTSLTTLAEVQAVTNGNYAYYSLATSTDTQITDATLIGQLNAIDSAVLPKPIAYITVGATDPNLPAPIKISYYGESE